MLASRLFAMTTRFQPASGSQADGHRSCAMQTRR